MMNIKRPRKSLDFFLYQQMQSKPDPSANGYAARKSCIMFKPMYTTHMSSTLLAETIIILVFALTVMRIKTPDLKLRSVIIQNLNIVPGASPSFSTTLIGQMTVKNKNFGHYTFDNSRVTVSYGGNTVGETQKAKGCAKARNTRKMNITMEVSSEKLWSNSNLSNDVSSGMLIVSSHAELSGKVQLMKIMKKRKTAEMNCIMKVYLTSQAIEDLNCE
ncbi:hypothetical protein HHK36_001657 [Tetracentron sinense]|uniref:Late embryogenesis abundant protein LEA-2 subgroup domain-containing protein n=1 Tax=Tetracentron sinense TaxID=13715 RepID=A0A834ZXX6_TETSI|nr:hypothetical protein HHK36_001657 [Tetracentron sinense]